jgi:hypothetical protein
MTAVFCWDCTSITNARHVTASIRCACGSRDVDLYDPQDVQQHARTRQVQAMRTPEPTFVQHMVGPQFTRTALAPSHPVGSEIPGWDVYKGPMPGPNPLQNSSDPHMGPMRCSVCKGSGYDLRDRNVCRECAGTGFMTPTTTPEPPAVARHQYPSTQTTVPFMGKRTRKTAAKPSVTTENARATKAPDWWKPMDYQHEQQAPLVMRGAACPTCDSPNTHLVTSSRGEGWWSCPNCGPMANIDKHPEIDPYNPPAGFKPKARTFRAASTRDKQVSRIATVVEAVRQQNPGLTPHQVVGLARETVRRYPEAQ